MAKSNNLLVREQWEKCSPLAQRITSALLKGDWIQMPAKMKPWGLAAFKKVMVAKLIDEVLKDESDQGK